MKYSKTIAKFFIGLISGVVATVAQNPEAIQTVVGAEKAVVIGSIVGLIQGVINYLKHMED